MSAAIRLPEMRHTGAGSAPAGTAVDLQAFIESHSRLVVLTGAGCSTRSGIPCYRDADGRWLQRRPILYQEFVASERTRRRYWARSFLGWPVVAAASVNPAHEALAALEKAGRLAGVITQNVDGLHRRAGQRRLIELHGRLDRVACLDCRRRSGRDALQHRMAALNRAWRAEVQSLRADGDAELDRRAWPGFRVVGCAACGGRLKPEVVFFGECVSPAVRRSVETMMAGADALLVVGSSLVVGSAWRLVHDAARHGLPVAAVNQGRTRAEDLLRFKVAGDCAVVLARAASAVSGWTPAKRGAK